MAALGLILTRRGWATAASGLVLVLGGRLLGTLELFVIGTGILSLVVLSLATVALARPRLGARRSPQPAQLHAGDHGVVRMVVANEGQRRTPAVLVDEEIWDLGPAAADSARSVSFQLAPLPRGHRQALTYRMATRRGRYRLGPMRVRVQDPFGLARRQTTGGRTHDVVVYPRVEALDPPVGSGGERRHGGSDHHRSLGSGHDLAALRPYEVGDDLRRVHWPSTARLGELMIRQNESPREDELLIVCDLRSQAHPDPSEPFEWILSAAASAVLACSGGSGRRTRTRLRVLTTDGFDSGGDLGAAAARQVLERLATAEPTPHTPSPAAAAATRRGGAVVLTTPAGLADLAERAGPTSATFVTVVDGAPSPSPSRARAQGIAVVTVTTRSAISAALGQAWRRSPAAARP